MDNWEELDQARGRKYERERERERNRLHQTRLKGTEPERQERK